jgi:dephospho-CoA kinase
VLATTFVETAFFVGMLVPAEPVVLLASVLAFGHQFSIGGVIAATFFGALFGDQVGYVIGRKGGDRFISKSPQVMRLWRRYEPITARLFRRQPIISITGARFISFVRTAMPWFAGMSGMKYSKFFRYDLLGVLGWTAASVSVAYAFDESWRAVAAGFGRFSAYVVGGILVLLFLLALKKRLRKMIWARRGIVRVALTGNIASGKSTVADIWRELGASIIDADVLARRAVEPGTSGHKQIVREFGADVLQDSEIDRAKLRRMVFDDARKRKVLESIIHPEVAKLRDKEEKQLVKSGQQVIVSDIPLLFETGLNKQYDVVVLVDAPDELRVQRIVEKRGLSEAEARSMVSAQMPSEQKRRPGVLVIDNDDTLADLRERAVSVWQAIVEGEA